MPKISIITLCHNYGHYLAECIDSVQHQTYRDFEHIVINAGSTDDTFTVMWHYADKIVPVVAQDLGVSTNRNHAIEIAKGEFITILDADDKMAPTFLEKLVVHASYRRLVCPALQEFDGGVNYGWPAWGMTFQDFVSSNRIFCCSMFSKQDWQEVGGYDSYLDRLGCEDWDMWTRMVKNGCDVVVEPTALFYYRVHDGSHSRRMHPRHGEIAAYIRRKHSYA